MSNLFLFGAGASAHSGACSPHSPPDGTSLFAALAKTGTAKALDRRFGRLFRDRFETGMAAVRRDADEHTTPFLRQMGEYLSKFDPGPDNFYIKLFTLLRDNGTPFRIATTNYDLLIERSLEQIDSPYFYTVPPYVFRHPLAGVTVLKIHGSCNFLPDTGSNTFSNNTFKNNRVNLSAPVRLARTPAELKNYYRTDTSFAPAMALYTEEKELLFCPDFVQRQQREFTYLVSCVRNIFVVGLRINERDVHIWSALAASPASLWYVAREADEFDGWVARHKRHNATYLAPTFEEALKVIPLHC